MSRRLSPNGDLNEQISRKGTRGVEEYSLPIDALRGVRAAGTSGLKNLVKGQ